MRFIFRYLQLNIFYLSLALVCISYEFSTSYANEVKPTIGKVSKHKSPNIEDYIKYLADIDHEHDIQNSKLQAQADQLRLKTIASIDKLLQADEIDKAGRFELLLRLGSTYVERHDYLRTREIESYSQLFDLWSEKGQKGIPPKIDYKESKKELRKAADTYRKLVIEFPHHPRTDLVLLVLAQTLSRLGNENAILFYNQLLKSHPDSSFVPDAYLALAEHYFDHNKLDDAIKNYRYVMNFKDHRVYPYSIYKLGWAYYNLGGESSEKAKENFQKSITAFKLVIKLAEVNKSNKAIINLRNEAVKDLVLVWAEAENVDSAWSYFSSLGEKKEYYNLLEYLGSLYAEQGKSQKAITLFTRLLKEAPLRDTSPQVHLKLIELADSQNQIDRVVEYLKTMQNLYMGQSEWKVARTYTIANDKDASNLIIQTKASIGFNLHRYGATYHKFYQKTQNIKYLHAAIKLYQSYLESFANLPESYEVRFYLADLLFDAKNYELAAKNYLKVSEQGNVKDKYYYDSAINAVESATLAVKDTKYSNLSEKGRLVNPLTIPAAELLLIDAADNFIKLFPNNEKVAAIRYTVANKFFIFGHYEISIKRFAEIIALNARSSQAEAAVKTILAFYASNQSWVKLIEWGRKILDSKSKFSPNTEKYVHEQLRVGVFKYGLALEKEKKNFQAAKVFMDFQSDFPKDESADKALYNASLNFYKGGKVMKALSAVILLLEKYPSSSLRSDVTLSVGETYRAIGEFEKAALYYAKFGDEFKNDKRAAESLHLAGILYKGLSKLDDAYKAFSLLIKGQSGSSFAKEALLFMAEIAESKGNNKEAIEYYKKFAKVFAPNNTDRALLALAKSYVLLGRTEGLNAEINALNSFKAMLRSNKHLVAKEARAIVAKELFNIYEKRVKKFNEFSINNLNTISKQVEEKNRLLIQLATKFQGIISLNNDEFTVASLIKIGEMHEKLADDLFQAPSPIKATQKELDAFKSKIERAAFPLRDDAYKYYRQAYDYARKGDSFSNWTQLAYNKMVLLEPKKYPPIKTKIIKPTYLKHKIYVTEATANLVE